MSLISDDLTTPTVVILVLVGWFCSGVLLLSCNMAASPRGPKDLKNDTGSVNFFKNFKGTYPPLPLPPKNGYVRPKKAIPGKTYLQNDILT